MNKPKISVITICFNARETIEPTLLSVLSQEYPELEYIVIDGDSTDGTKEILSRYAGRIDRIISEKDAGIYDAMNKGLALATGEWVTFRNSGDYFLSPRTLRAVFDRDIPDDVMILHGDCIYINDWGYKYMTPGCLSHSYKEGMPVLHPATFVRTAFHQSHPFDLSFRSSGDYKFLFDCCEGGIRLEYCNLPIATFQTGGFAMSHLKKTFWEDCRIKGWDKGICNRIRSWSQFIVLSIKITILEICGKIPFLARLRKQNLIREGWRNLPYDVNTYYPKSDG